MKAVKRLLTAMMLLMVASRADAESRTVLVQVKPGKDKKACVAIHSEEKQEQRSAASVDDAVKTIGQMKGWGSRVGVYIACDHSISSADVKKLLAAVNDNPWLALDYFGREVPAVVANHFLKTAQRPKAAQKDEVMAFAAETKRIQANSPTPVHRASDVQLIANWLCGTDLGKAFTEPFGDRTFFADDQRALLYTDVTDVKPPATMEAAHYEVIQARMALVRGGHKVPPAVLIVRSSLADPAGERAVQDTVKPSGRVYYVEVAIGNLAWHCLKVVVRDNNGSMHAEVIRHKMSSLRGAWSNCACGPPRAFPE